MSSRLNRHWPSAVRSMGIKADEVREETDVNYDSDADVRREAGFLGAEDLRVWPSGLVTARPPAPTPPRPSPPRPPAAICLNR